MLNRMSALLSAAIMLLCLAGGCGNNSGRDTMTDDTTGFGRELDVEEPIDTNMPNDIRQTSPDIPGDDSRQKSGKDSLRPAPQVP